MVSTNQQPSHAAPTTTALGCELDDLYLMNSQTCQRIHPNEQLHCINNDLLSGHMIAMFPTNDHHLDHFVGKKRKCELQFQVKFKTIPKEQLYIGCELKKPLKAGIFGRKFIKAILNGVQRKNPSFRYSLSGSGSSSGSSSSTDGTCASEDSSYSETNDTSHMSMPFESSLSALVVTKQGDIPPTLGLGMARSYVSIGDIDFNTSDTYTFSIWSAYGDLLKWQCSIVAPVVQSIPLKSIIGNQTFTLNFYSMKDPKATMNSRNCRRNGTSFVKDHAKASRNCRRNVTSYMEFEFGHKESDIGPARKEWLHGQEGCTNNNSLFDDDEDTSMREDAAAEDWYSGWGYNDETHGCMPVCWTTCEI